MGKRTDKRRPKQRLRPNSYACVQQYEPVVVFLLSAFHCSLGTVIPFGSLLHSSLSDRFFSSTGNEQARRVDTGVIHNKRAKLVRPAGITSEQFPVSDRSTRRTLSYSCSRRSPFRGWTGGESSSAKRGNLFFCVCHINPRTSPLD